MNCCANCFSSAYLKSFFKNDDLGNCAFCNSRNVPILDASTFSDLFKSLLDYYVTNDEIGNFIETQISIDFPNQILADGVPVRALLRSVLSADYGEYSDLLAKRIALRIKVDNRHEAESEVYNKTWEDFKSEIKYSNRFHLTKVICKLPRKLGHSKVSFSVYKQK